MSDRDQTQPGVMRRTIQAIGNGEATRTERVRAAGVLAASTAAVIGVGTGLVVGGGDVVSLVATSGVGHALATLASQQEPELLAVGSATGLATIVNVLGTGDDPKFRTANRQTFRRVRAASAAVTVGIAAAAAGAEAVGLGGLGHVLIESAVVTGGAAVGSSLIAGLNGIGLRQYRRELSLGAGQGIE